jgi:hypothetical protein
MRETWTDGRLDDLNRHVEEGFRELRGEMNARFERVDAENRELRGEMNARFDTLQRTLLQTSAVMIAALIGLIATQL